MTANRLFWGIIVLFAGILWLLSNLGLIPSSIWYQLWRLWPILIILWGVSILFSKSGVKSIWLSMVMVVIIAAAVSAFAFLFRNQKVESQVMEVTETISENTKTANLDFALGAVDFLLSGGSENLLEGEADTITGIEVSNSTNDGVQKIQVNQLPFRGFMIGPNFKNRIDFKTTNNIPMKINIDSGASKINLDLEQVMLESLDIDSGATSSNITIGDKIGEVDINISSGASSFDLKVPEGFAIKIINKSGLSGNNLSELGLSRNGEVWQSSDYDTNNKVIEITFESGASNLDIGKY
jgi:hypothetical protein